MEPKDLSDQVIAAGKEAKESNQTLSEGGAGTVNIVSLPPGIDIRLYLWASGGDPERPIELAIGETKIRMKPGEAGLLMKILEREIRSWCIFEAAREDLMDTALRNAKDGTEN